MAEETHESSPRAADTPVAGPSPEGGAPPAVPSGPPTEGRRPPFGAKRFQRRKVCAFCVEKITYVDYKDVKRIRRFVTERGKILPRRISGNCSAHQRMLTTALKRARNIALVPFKAE